MRAFLILSMLICTLGLKAQSTDYTKRLPSKFGVTHHFINEDKIQLMKNANEVKDLITKYKYNVKIGYAEVAIGTGILTFAGCFMKVPQKYSSGYQKDRYDRYKRNRYIVAGVGILFTTVGCVTIYNNHKKLRKVDLHMSPVSGGFRFYF